MDDKRFVGFIEVGVKDEEPKDEFVVDNGRAKWDVDNETYKSIWGWRRWLKWQQRVW